MLRKYYHAEGVQRAWWPARKNSYSPEFQMFLSETKPPEELTARCSNCSAKEVTRGGAEVRAYYRHSESVNRKYPDEVRIKK